MTLPGATETNAGNNYMILLSPTFLSISEKDILQPVEADSYYQMVNI